MRKNMWMVLFLSLMFSLIGCGNSDTETAQGGQGMESANTKTDSEDKEETNIVISINKIVR